MQAIELLLNRRSQPRLTNPAPEGQQLENIMQAALRAPDHANLTPWHFVVCQGEGLARLGDIYLQAAKRAGKGQEDLERAAKLPHRAPMVIVAIAKYTEHAKVPWVEQIASASCAVHAMQMAAQAQGFAGIWRTGSYAQNEDVKAAFNLAPQDEIVGFLYLGTAATQPTPPQPLETEKYFEFWR